MAGSRPPGVGRTERSFGNDDVMHLPGNSLSGYGLDDDRRLSTTRALHALDARALIRHVKARYIRLGAESR